MEAIKNVPGLDEEELEELKSRSKKGAKASGFENLPKMQLFEDEDFEEVGQQTVVSSNKMDEDDEEFDKVLAKHRKEFSDENKKWLKIKVDFEIFEMIDSICRE